MNITPTRINVLATALFGQSCMFSRARMQDMMTFLSGQDEFFQTVDQQISVRHFTRSYNKMPYIYSAYAV